jgi:hypothetical protein
MASDASQLDANMLMRVCKATLASSSESRTEVRPQHWETFYLWKHAAGKRSLYGLRGTGGV